jgi:hypothetical protein
MSFGSSKRHSITALSPDRSVVGVAKWRKLEASLRNQRPFPFMHGFQLRHFIQLVEIPQRLHTPV